MTRSPFYIMYMCVQSRCKKVNTATYVHMGGVSNTYSDYVLFIGRQPAGSERRNCVVFIGRQWNASCSSGANRLGRNNRNEAWRTGEWRKQPSNRSAMVETGSYS